MASPTGAGGQGASAGTGQPWGCVGSPPAMTPNRAHCWLWDEPSTSTVAFLKRVPRDREVHAAEKGLEPWHRLPPPSLDPLQQNSGWEQLCRVEGMEPFLTRRCRDASQHALVAAGKMLVSEEFRCAGAEGEFLGRKGTTSIATPEPLPWGHV